MHETRFSFSRIETPVPGAALPQGPHVIRGWVLPKSGGHFVGVRARIGERRFDGVHGFPRTDVAGHFQTGRPIAFAEFSVAVELAPGRAEVVLEALEIDGYWAPFQSVVFEVRAAAVPPPVAPGGEVRWLEYTRALRELLRDGGGDTEARARAFVAGLPTPRDRLRPPAPFHGYLDEPAATSGVRFGRMVVGGHLFHESLRVTRVSATTDLLAWQTLDSGRASAGAAAHHPAFANAAACGFSGLVDVPAQLPNPVCLRVCAELEDGSSHLCFGAGTQRQTDDDEKRPFAPYRADAFAECEAALRRAFAENHFALIQDADFTGAVAHLREEYELQAPRRAPSSVALVRFSGPSGAPLPRRVLLATHSLGREGAPLFLLSLARGLAGQGVQLEIVSPEDGPLRAEFARIAERTHLVDTRAFTAATDDDATLAAAEILARTVELTRFDLVVANTFTAFWAVHAAATAGVRSLLYVHESTSPAVFYQGRLPPRAIAAVEKSLAMADCVSFTSAATRRRHRRDGQPENHRLTPGWIDVAAIDRWRTEHPRAALRDRFGLRPEELLVTNVGTVSSRKGQHVFARAVELLWRRYPELARRCRFVTLGARASAFDTMLRDLLAQLGRTNLHLHDETADYLPYYAAADLFVCSSYEESSPRVILETMACLTPLLSSAVDGVSELVRPDLEATLVPAGDTAALAEGMARLLFAPEIGCSLAARARARVVEQFSADRVLPHHLALASAVAAGRL
ncbi:MAG: glycosyltransferase family 4 protein [Opitutae bacterium]|nr:glycosyltransferase family 4 protein [Opitutae bacterium]